MLRTIQTMISGYLPFLIHTILLLGLFGGVGAVDGWLRGIAQAQADSSKPMLLGFLGGCAR